MALKGDLASVDLAQVFQMLALNQKVGMLSIQSPKAWKSLYFDQRGVTPYFNEHNMLDRVLAQMVRTDQISEDAVDEAREHSAKMGVPVIDSLLAGGLLNDQDLDSAIRAELEEDLYDIFFWRDARFEFFEGASPDAGPEAEGVANERFFFSTDMLIMEAARRIDEWSYIQQRVSNPLEIHRPLNSKAGVMEMEGEVLPILELLDGKRNVGRLIEITGLAPFHLYKGLATLIDQGVIEPVPSDDILPSAKECFREGRLQDAINLFEKAISDGVGIPEAHVLAAEAYSAIGEHELANYHTKCVAEFRIEDGALKEAVALLRTVIETIPTDLSARERIVELTAGHAELKTEDFDPLSLSKGLVDLYLDIGELERVRTILEGLLLAHPEDIEFKKSLINVHSKAGDTKRVIELYESMADDLVKSRNPIEAIKFLQKIVMLDRSRKDISERIKSLYQMDERRRSRRRSIMALVFMLCLIVAGAVGYFYYDQIAGSRWARLQGDVNAQVKNEQYDAALRLIDNFLSTYPYTMVGREVRATRKQIEVKRDLFAETILQEEQRRRAELKINRHRQKSTWQNYENEFKQGNLPAALEAIEVCRKLVFKADMPKDYQWWSARNGEQAIVDLKNYMGQSAAVDRRYREAKDKGDWQEARKYALELVTKFELSSYARRAEIPLQLDSRPAGAFVYRKGKPLTVTVDGATRVLRTPAIIYCPALPEVEFELRKPGFTATKITVHPHENEAATFTMSQTPRVLRFRWPAMTGCGAARGRAAVGLRGGKVGIVRLDDPSQRVTGSLEGLSDVAGVPMVTANYVIFISNLGKVVCHSLLNGAQEWEVKPTNAIDYDLMVKNGRVFVVDRGGRLICLRAVSGKKLWSQSLDGLASGRPTPYGNSRILIGSQTGAVLILNVTNGNILRKLPVKVGVSSRVVTRDGMLVFGTTDGKVRGFSLATGKETWNEDAGRAVREEEIVVSPAGRWVYHMAAEDWLVKRDVLRGTKLRSVRVPGHLRSGPIVQNGKVYVVVREMTEKGGRRRFHDLLMAFDEGNLQLQWKFKDGGDFHGRMFGDGGEILITGSKGEVYRFK
ncbi:MAG: DUF4388 domain-containing protein [Planctomycetota bacterium]|jgi:outer membrane protein assembly factor BamB/tetratricopeptide (TPR) repeat protein